MSAQLRRSEWARLGTFLFAALLVVLSFDAEYLQLPARVGALLVFTGFILLVRHHRGLQRAAADERARMELCELGEARVLRAWARMIGMSFPAARQDHPFARDLGVTGPASLWQLVNVVGASPGRPVLAGWLLSESPPEVAEIRARQEAVRELAAQTEWRELLAVQARRISAHAPKSLSGFIDWAEQSPWLGQRRGLNWLAIIMPALSLALLILTVAAPRFYVLVPALMLINGIATAMTMRAAGRAIHSAAIRPADVAGYRAMLEQASALTPKSGLLQAAHARLLDPPALLALGRLARIVAWSEARHNTVLYPIAQIFFLYDLLLVRVLEQWQQRFGPQARGWFDALAQIEALAALATLAHDNPDWTFPLVDDAETAITVRALGHPLIAGQQRVANDLPLGPAGTVLIVTGSNLSGKTTLLRAAGANQVLAQAGAPVCAAELRAPRLRIWTSMHVGDSLADGRSLFSAELQQLKNVVDAAREVGRPPVLYLLDEVLRGTNAPERHSAVIAILRHLMRTSAVGAITTHDLDLAAAPQLEERQRLVHFREFFEEGPAGPTMRFDFLLRPGPATTSNALALLRLLGLGEPEG